MMKMIGETIGVRFEFAEEDIIQAYEIQPGRLIIYLPKESLSGALRKYQKLYRPRRRKESGVRAEPREVPELASRLDPKIPSLVYQ